MIKIITGCLVAALALLFLGSCNDKIDIRQAYDFALSSWHLPSEIKNGEQIEIRLTLSRQGDFKGAKYYIGYIQMQGKGEVTDAAEVLLVNREQIELSVLPDLDTNDPCRQVFTLFYKSTGTKKSEVKFVVTDNFGQQRELTLAFDANTSDE